jgi:hypothetical protein
MQIIVAPAMRTLLESCLAELLVSRRTVCSNWSKPDRLIRSSMRYTDLDLRRDLPQNPLTRFPHGDRNMPFLFRIG